MRQLKAVVLMRTLRGFGFEGILVLGLVMSLTALVRAAETSDNTDTLPMFGQPKVARSDKQKQADEAFIRDNTLRYKTRQAASMAFATQGWTAVRAKQLDAAMVRFNHAWLLNPKNYSAFWGFGAILSERGRLLDAIEQLETARELIDDPTQRPALLADLGNAAFGVRRPAWR